VHRPDLVVTATDAAAEPPPPTLTRLDWTALVSLIAAMAASVIRAMQ